MYHVYVYSWVLVCALSIHSGTHVLKSCDHPLSSHQQLLIQSRATAACMVGHINFLLKPAQPSPARPIFFFSPMHRQLWGPQLGLSGPDHCIGCPSHVCLQWVGLLSVKRSNGRNGWWRRTEEDESCTWIEAERRAVYSFVYVHIHGSGSQQKYTGTRGSASCTFNLFLAFLFCPLVCPLRF